MFNLLPTKKNKTVPFTEFDSFRPFNFNPFNEEELSTIIGGCEEPMLIDYDRFKSLDLGEDY
jgi:hypothetical protein